MLVLLAPLGHHVLAYGVQQCRTLGGPVLYKEVSPNIRHAGQEVDVEPPVFTVQALDDLLQQPPPRALVVSRRLDQAAGQPRRVKFREGEGRGQLPDTLIYDQVGAGSVALPVQADGEVAVEGRADDKGKLPPHLGNPLEMAQDVEQQGQHLVGQSVHR